MARIGRHRKRRGRELAWRSAEFCWCCGWALILSNVVFWTLLWVQSTSQTLIHKIQTLDHASIAVTPSDSPAAAADGPRTLLNHNLIQSSLLAEAPWAESHGADHAKYLGAAMLYYSFAYAFQCQTIVVLGSGGGFVPRILRQAQRDLQASGALSSSAAPVLILVDAHLASAGYGSTFYAENEDTIMRQQFRDIRYVFQKTDDAFVQLKNEGISIDYLHVDADHSAEQSWKDFENFSTLLSDRGVVSFHDTCRDKERKCRTGVPQTIHKLSQSLDEYKYQLIDAHYLYRGIAFAIPATAPALEAPANKRRNFCQTNAAVLSKTSPGFTLNKRVGSLPSLGDFYQCHKRFNMTALGAPCPWGSRRDKNGGCSDCIPGMLGDDCHTFQYSSPKPVTNIATRSSNNPRSVLTATAWLRERDAQHIFEFGVSSSGEPISKHLQHEFQSFVAVDSRIQEPKWTEDGVVPQVRWLPCKPQDVISGLHSELVPLQSVDALVCLRCDERFSRRPDILSAILSKYFPLVTAVILEGSALAQEKQTQLDQFLEGFSALSSTWQIEADVTMNSAAPRRMLMLARSSNEPFSASLQTTKKREVVPKAKLSSKPIAPFRNFEVAGVNLGSFGLEDRTTSKADASAAPFLLFDDFDLSDQITGNETWQDLVRYRRDAQRRSLCFFVDKVARKRWLKTVGIPSPKTFLLKYASELTDTAQLHDEHVAITNTIPSGVDFAAKPTHLSCAGGVWLTKKFTSVSDENTTWVSHGTKKFEKVEKFNVDEVAASLARDLHEGPRCGSQRESWALENVKPGVLIEERFTSIDGDDDAGGMEFKVVTIWGRVWLAQWRPGTSRVRAFLHRNGTALDWEEAEPLPDWVDWPRIVSLAERLGEHKDMFRTDIFVGVPAGSLPVGATREEKLARVRYVVSETEIHPTPIKGTDEVFKEAGRLWLAGYKMGNYRVVPDAEVPSEFLENGSFAVQAQG